MARGTVVPKSSITRTRAVCPWLKANSSSGPSSTSGLPSTVTSRRAMMCTSSQPALVLPGRDDKKSVSPDLMVVFGASKHVRSSYRLWESRRRRTLSWKWPRRVRTGAIGVRSATSTRTWACRNTGSAIRRGVISIRRCGLSACRGALCTDPRCGNRRRHASRTQ